MSNELMNLYELLTDLSFVDEQSQTRKIMRQKAKALRAKESDGQDDNNGRDSEQIVLDWLARLSLLHFVPFNYLVADEQMLPIESIRFFQVDPNWLHYLADGACSIVRATETEHTHEKVYRHERHANVMQRLAHVRYQPVPRLLKFFLNSIEDELSLDSEMSGFLLRSSVVSGWPGLEVIAYSHEDESESTQLMPLRIETVSDNVLLCLFAGRIHHITVREPGEGIHFGIQVEDQRFVKQLRASGIAEDMKPASKKTLSVQVDFPKEDERATGVLPIQALVNAMEETLEIQKGHLTVAEWALQMVQGSAAVKFSRPVNAKQVISGYKK